MKEFKLKRIIKGIVSAGFIGVLVFVGQWFLAREIKNLSFVESGKKIAALQGENLCQQAPTAEQANPAANLFVGCGGFLE